MSLASSDGISIRKSSNSIQIPIVRLLDEHAHFGARVGVSGSRSTINLRVAHDDIPLHSYDDGINREETEIERKREGREGEEATVRDNAQIPLLEQPTEPPDQQRNGDRLRSSMERIALQKNISLHHFLFYYTLAFFYPSNSSQC